MHKFENYLSSSSSQRRQLSRNVVYQTSYHQLHSKPKLANVTGVNASKSVEHTLRSKVFTLQ